MKKIIRLTESDLTRIVKRVIKENSVKDDLIQSIKDEGWDSATELVGGSKNLAKLAFNNNPIDFLHMFDDLNVVESEKNKNWMLYSYQPEKILIIYNIGNGGVFINFYEIWGVLKYGFGLNQSEIEELTQKWFSDTYNLRVSSTSQTVF